MDKNIFNEESLKQNKILRYTLITLGVIVILVVLAVIVPGTKSSPQEETRPQEQILSQKSIEREDRDVCREAKNEVLQKECENSYFFGLAQKKQDPKLCDQDADTTQANQCWNVYHTQSMLNPTSDGKQQPLDCSLLRGDDAKADCTGIALSIERGDIQRLTEACQMQKTSVFSMICVTALHQGGVPGGDLMTQTQ